PAFGHVAKSPYATDHFSPHDLWLRMKLEHATVLGFQHIIAPVVLWGRDSLPAFREHIGILELPGNGFEHHSLLPGPQDGIGEPPHCDELLTIGCDSTLRIHNNNALSRRFQSCAQGLGSLPNPPPQYGDPQGAG